MAAGASAITGGQEAFRGYNDPLYQPIETAYALGGSTIFGGLLGGTIGAVTKNAGKNFAKATYADDGADEVIDEIDSTKTYNKTEKQPMPVKTKILKTKKILK